MINNATATLRLLGLAHKIFKIYMDITKLQTQLDEIKTKVAQNNEYTTLSGLNMLPRDWTIQPYVHLVKTGINPNVNEGTNMVESFVFDFEVKIKKHNIDELNCNCTSNSSMSAKVKFSESEQKPLASWSEQEKSDLAESNKQSANIEYLCLKKAEFDFFDMLHDHLLKEDAEL